MDVDPSAEICSGSVRVNADDDDPSEVQSPPDLNRPSSETHRCTITKDFTLDSGSDDDIRKNSGFYNIV